MMERLLDDLRYAARTLRKSPGFTAVAVLTLALGIGANTAIWSLVHAVLLTPLPIAGADRVVKLAATIRRDGLELRSVSYPDFADWRQAARSFSDMAAWSNTSFTLTGGPEPERVEGEMVSASYFPVLGTKAVLGRTFRPEEDATPGTHPVAVIGHDFWQRRFAGSRAAVGSHLVLNGHDFTVVGVLPDGFRGLDDDTDVFIPMMMSATVQTAYLDSRGSRWHDVIARLAPGVTPARAQAEMDTVTARLARQYPDVDRDYGALVVPLREEIMGGFRPVLFILLGAVGFVLLIACANVANLMLARSAARQRETAIRAALGAGRGRLARQLLTESLLLALAGGLLGLLVALWTKDLLTAWSPINLPSFVHVGLDGPVLAFACAVALGTGLLMGLAPAFQVSSLGVGEALKEGGRGAAGGGARSRLRRGLVTAEVALSLLLLVGAGLMIQSFRHMQAIDPGFRPDHLLTLRVALPAARYPGEKAWAMGERVLARVRALPGVTAAALASDMPLEGNSSASTIAVEDHPVAPGARGIRAYYHAVSPGFFAALGARLRRGREVTAADGPGSVPVVVVSEKFARRAWPGEEPMGKRLRVGGKSRPWATVVGIAADLRYGRLVAAPQRFPEDPDLYLPFAQRPVTDLGLLVRTATAPEAFATTLRRELAALDRDAPIYALTPMAELAGLQTARSRFGAFLMGAFGALALLLAALGVYGVISYSVAQRGHEIGVRMALGARREEVFRLVLGQALGLAAVGMALGISGALALTRLLAGQLYGLSPNDPATYAAVALLLAAAALVAGYLPARRATRVDPVVVLKQD
ncbi:MAG TPA: ABC transporter permease [Thermoanaerobaculia bacterium]|nr:ABC transporter permease [Thermoanaerobaculia bacterium]